MKKIVLKNSGIRKTHLAKKFLYLNKRGNSALAKNLFGYINSNDWSVFLYDLESRNNCQSGTPGNADSETCSTLLNIRKNNSNKIVIARYCYQLYQEQNFPSSWYY